MKLFWLSFCDVTRPEGQRFVGVSVVEGKDFLDACKAAHRLGCNPGGEISGGALPDESVKIVAATDRNRLLVHAEAMRLARALDES